MKDRKQGNVISSLVSENGETFSSSASISAESSRFFSALLFEDSPPTEVDEALILGSIPNLVTREMNESLLRPIPLFELEAVVFQMKRGKAPGPDGFLAKFFQEFWEVIKLDLLAVVQESLLNKQMLRSMNATFLTLIPKKVGDNTLDNFRPIALCNVVYKIITKLIAERLKPWLGRLILEEQGGFVVGRQILDGVIIAGETIHSMASSKEKATFIKLDIAKAYDRVKWAFLFKLLEAFGFAGDWIEWVRSCVTSSSFSVLVNGEPSELFKASRGLRQGDPLSPYLFILLAEGLGRYIRSRVECGLIQGWSWGNNIPSQSHLQFVDDTALMGRAKIEEAVRWRSTLDYYLAASGQ